MRDIASIDIDRAKIRWQAMSPKEDEDNEIILANERRTFRPTLVWSSGAQSKQAILDATWPAGSTCATALRDKFTCQLFNRQF
jgi:hypothetical protein